MLRTYRIAAYLGITLFALLGMAACSKSVERKYDTTFPPNMMIFYQPMEVVWDELTHLLKYDLLYNVPVENRKAHFFTTDWVNDEQLGMRFKTRLSGTLKFEGQGVAVVLYREVMVQTNGSWQSQASDYGMEHFILGKLTAKLKTHPMMPPIPAKKR